MKQSSTVHAIHDEISNFYNNKERGLNNFPNFYSNRLRTYRKIYCEFCYVAWTWICLLCHPSQVLRKQDASWEPGKRYSSSIIRPLKKHWTYKICRGFKCSLKKSSLRGNLLPKQSRIFRTLFTLKKYWAYKIFLSW